MLTVFDTDVLTVIRPTVRKEYGSDVDDWTTPVAHDITGCAIQGGDSREDHYKATGVTADFTIWAPVDADINANDRVRFTYGGRNYDNYEVDGTPKPMIDPFNILSHLEIAVTKREG